MNTVSQHLPQNVAGQLLRSLLASGRAVSGFVYADIDAPSDDAMYCVSWVPSGLQSALPDHLRDMVDSRAVRAAVQACEMEFVPAADEPGMWFCIHTVPQWRGRGKKRCQAEDDVRIYETRTKGCTCPDRDITLRRYGGIVECKHQIALRAHLSREKEETDGTGTYGRG